jgi:hypothetical protein
MRKTAGEIIAMGREKFKDALLEELREKAEDPNLSEEERERRRAEVKKVAAQLAERRKREGVAVEKS